jgi:calcineurin-like phosphoesterase family protein
VTGCRRGWRASVLLVLAACAGSPLPTPAPVPALPRDQVATTLYLIGDAGSPAPGGEPVLQALRRDLETGTGQRVVVFLGDNVYPRGLPPAHEPRRPEAERRLAAQIELITTTGVAGYFVPGNHDWARSGTEGWAAIRRQGEFIDSAGRGRVSLLPRDGCPGPVAVDIGARVRLVLLDTQWWLEAGAKPQDPTSNCPADTQAEVVDSLRADVRPSDGRLVVVAAHHPLASGGEHGGYFGWEDHLFPLRQAAPWLWLPLPLIGSLYPAARQHGISSQDIPSPRYQRLIAAFRRAFADAQPALYAAGHEHNLQVISGGPAQLELVSGGGIYDHSGRAVRIDGSLFARKASGFARLDVPTSGRARLAVFEVDHAGQAREVFSIWVD